MRVGVTGANGYIGRAVISSLRAQGHKAVAFARTGRPEGLPADINWHVSADGIPGEAWLAECDALIHAAGHGHVRARLHAGEDLFDRANRQLAVRTAVMACRAHLRSFVLVSSAGVHGSWSEEEVDAESPIKPDSPVALSKWAAESELAAMMAGSPTRLQVVRSPMVYGLGCPGNFGRVVDLAGRGWPLPFASVDAVRSFIHVDNLASLLVHCADSPVSVRIVACDGSDWSLSGLLKRIAVLRGQRLTQFPVPPGALRIAAGLLGRGREADMLTRPMRVSSARLHESTGWRPPLAPANALAQALRGSTA